MTSLYEILVPTVHRRKLDARGQPKPIKTRFHRVWDEKVRAISGGLTVLTPAKGQWISPDGVLFRDRMIPVRFVAHNEEDVERVIDITLAHYDELAVMCYRVSDHVIIKHASEN